MIRFGVFFFFYFTQTIAFVTRVSETKIAFSESLVEYFIRYTYVSEIR